MFIPFWEGGQEREISSTHPNRFNMAL